MYFLKAVDIANKYRMLSPDEVELIQECVRRLPNYPVIVNIGANVGTSTCAILEANHRATIHSIDRRKWDQELQNVVLCGHNPNRVNQIIVDTNKIKWTKEVDMVFVDGGHDDKTVRNDIAKFKPYCRHIMLFHDYDHPNYQGTNVHLTQIVDEEMVDWKEIGRARYLVAYER